MKAVKNRTELDGMRQAHVRDGVALVRWLVWLEGEIGRNPHTEITIADKLTEFRQLGDHFRGLSFGNISGYAANSAVGHYSPQPDTTPTLHPDNILLIDSGGQYCDGTTDVTRTLALGEPTAAHKRIFTTVLQSLIRLTTATFPSGTTGQQLDALAREPLWRDGLNCRHGIGHGVGSYLNVHEGPHGVSSQNRVPFEPGMVTTIEPGVYFEGSFGVRLENMVVTVSAETTSFGDFYKFETVTLCPFDLKLVDVDRLTTFERDWLKCYHQRVFTTLTPFLTPDEQLWLRHTTRPI
jgi:Xaa-Pro aminopeptidase